jgi:hypothetical protein
MTMFGYVSLFVAAFPNGVAIAVISYSVRLLIDGWKLCQVFRRPQPKTAEDIGVWEAVMHFISVVSAVYTFAIICFSQKYLTSVTWEYRWVYFILMEHLALIIKYYLMETIDDVPGDVKTQLERQKFIVSKVIDGEQDEKEDQNPPVVIPPDFPINIYDTDYGYPQKPGEEDEEASRAIYKLLDMKEEDHSRTVNLNDDDENKEE